MHDQRLERLTFFSDAVFAIAMTLLVIELRVPEVHHWTDAGFVQALLDMLPNFLGFLISFFVIGTFWVAHHRGFAMAGRYTPDLAWPNLLLLLAIVFLPFATAFMSEYYGARVPHVLYIAVLLAAAFAQRRLMVRALRDGRLAENVDRHEAHGYLMRLWAVPIAGAIALIVALVAPPYSVMLLLLILPLTRLLERRGRTAA